jgi:hypothetical protein
MEPLADLGHVEAHFGLFGDGVSIGAWNPISVHLEMVLLLVQDRYTVYAKHTIRSRSFWMYLMVLQGDEAQVEAQFGLFGDSTNLDAI